MLLANKNGDHSRNVVFVDHREEVKLDPGVGASSKGIN